MLTKILVITSQYLSHLFYEVFDNLNLPVKFTIKEVEIGDFGKNINIDEFINYDLVITSGAHLELLNKEYSELNYIIPIYPLKFNESDIVRSIVLAKKYSNNILLMFYNSELYNLNEYKEILGVDLIVQQYNSINQGVELLNLYREKGYNTIIGTSSIYEIAKKREMNSILIYSEENLKLEFTKAYQLASIRSKLVRYENYNKIMFEAINCPLFLTDSTGLIIDVNENGIGYTEKNYKHELIGKNIETFLNISKLNSEKINILENIDKNINIKPITLGENNIYGYLIIVNTEFQSPTKNEKLMKQKSVTLKSKYEFKDIHHKSSIMKKTIIKGKQYSKSDAPILIFGESGTGKELIAHSIHSYSNRNQNPFLPVNCSAIPKNILESELFGYEEGAFTGALKGGKPGYFELAQGGSIFLDEIAEIPLDIQAKLLRVLQEKEVIRLGGRNIIPLDVRIITATNKSLAKLVQEGSFREDLFYRINVLQINVPPLRERTEDIITIFEHLLMKHGMTIDQASYLANYSKNTITDYQWPGNIRELENFTQRLTALSSIYSSNYDLAMCLSDVFMEFIYNDNRKEVGHEESENSYFNNLRIIIETEKKEIVNALQQAKGNKLKAADILGMSRTTLWRKIKDYNVY